MSLHLCIHTYVTAHSRFPPTYRIKIPCMDISGDAAYARLVSGSVFCLDTCQFDYGVASPTIECKAHAVHSRIRTGYVRAIQCVQDLRLYHRQRGYEVVLYVSRVRFLRLLDLDGKHFDSQSPYPRPSKSCHLWQGSSNSNTQTKGSNTYHCPQQ